MKTTRNFLIVAALALAVCAGAAVAGQTDVAAAITALFHSPEGLLAGASLAWGPMVRDLQGKHAAAVDSAKGILSKAEAEDRDMTDDEKKAFADHQARAASLKNRIESAQAQELAEAGVQAQAPAGRGEGAVNIGAAATVSVTENVTQDTKRGFAQKGEFFKAVKHAASAQALGAQIDPRLKIGAAAPGTYGNEGSGADGAFAIPPAFSAEIWRLSLEDGSLIPMTLNTEVSGNSMVFPKDETTPWGGTGVQAYWKGEATAGNASKLALGTSMLRLKELMVLVPMTNELLEDAPALGSYLTPLAAERIQWKANEAVLFGTGGSQPLGCMSSSALVTVAKETSQAAATIQQPNISKMRSRLIPGQLKNALWIGNPDILPQLEGMTVGQIPIFLPPGTGLREGGYDGTLNGRPLILSEHANALGAAGDLSLLSLKGYRTITKAGGIETATSMHLYFDANATAFRFIFRMDGEPVIQQPVTPPAGKSTSTRSYFVTLGARA